MEKLYVVVRSDLAAGDQIAQVGHAVASFALHSPVSHALARQWHGGANNLVVLGIADEAALERLMDEIVERTDATCVVVNEPDLDDDLTAIAFEGTAQSRRLVSSLPLALRDVGALGATGS